MEQNATSNSTSLYFMLAWQVVVSLTFLSIGFIALGLPAGSLGPLEVGWLGWMFLTYIASTLPLALRFRDQLAVGLPIVVLATAAAFAIAWLLSPLLTSGWIEVWPFLANQKDWDLLDWLIPPGLVLATALFAIVSNGLLTGSERVRRNALLALSVALLLMLATNFAPLRSPLIYRALEHPVVYEMDASRYRLRVSYFREHIPPPAAPGGAVIAVLDRMLLMTGDGWFYELQVADGTANLEVHPLHQRAPLNREEFLQANPGMSQFIRGVFRTSDMLLIEDPQTGSKQLLVSHHYYHAERDCYSVRVSALTTTWNDFMSGDQAAHWRTVYEAQPCLALHPNGKLRFTGHQTGGTLVQIEPGTFLIALGDAGFDGVQSADAYPQDMTNDFGKIIEVDLISGQSRPITAGHRSPAGLYAETSGRLWLTEHGPRGGDELNLVRPGRDYGWPQHSLGVQYGEMAWPAQVDAEIAAAFESPEFAWTPSIGISTLLGLRGREFEKWRGDLLVSSLVDRALYRVQLADGRPILAERIPVYERVRDVVQDERGRIIFWTDRGVIGLIEDAK